MTTQDRPEGLDDFLKEPSRKVKTELDLWASSGRRPLPGPEEKEHFAAVLTILIEGIEQFLQEFLNDTHTSIQSIAQIIGLSLPLITSLYHYYPELMDELAWRSGCILHEDARHTVDGLKDLIEYSTELDDPSRGRPVMVDLEMLRQYTEAELREMLPEHAIEQLIQHGKWPY